MLSRESQEGKEAEIKEEEARIGKKCIRNVIKELIVTPKNI